MMSRLLFRPIEILLVEDSPSDANLTMRSLKQGRVTNNLTWLENGEAAIDYLRQQGDYADATRPDLIVLDLNLPRVDGREVLEAVKSDSELRRIPVVILTTSADETDIVRSYSLNANCYITKPVDIRAFIQAVQSIHEFWLEVASLPPE